MLIGQEPLTMQNSGSTVEEPLCHTIQHQSHYRHFSLLTPHPHHPQVPAVSYLSVIRSLFLFLFTHHVSTAKSGYCDIIPLLQSAGSCVNFTIMSSCLKVTLHQSTLRSVLKARPIYYPCISSLQSAGLPSSTTRKCRHTKHLHRRNKTGAQ
jgi:hypothetical protein